MIERKRVDVTKEGKNIFTWRISHHLVTFNEDQC